MDLRVLIFAHDLPMKDLHREFIILPKEFTTLPSLRMRITPPTIPIRVAKKEVLGEFLAESEVFSTVEVEEDLEEAEVA